MTRARLQLFTVLGMAAAALASSGCSGTEKETVDDAPPTADIRPAILRPHFFYRSYESRNGKAFLVRDGQHFIAVLSAHYVDFASALEKVALETTTTGRHVTTCERLWGVPGDGGDSQGLDLSTDFVFLACEPPTMPVRTFSFATTLPAVGAKVSFPNAHLQSQRWLALQTSSRVSSVEKTYLSASLDVGDPDGLSGSPLLDAQGLVIGTFSRGGQIDGTTVGHFTKGPTLAARLQKNKTIRPLREAFGHSRVTQLLGRYHEADAAVTDGFAALQQGLLEPAAAAFAVAQKSAPHSVYALEAARAQLPMHALVQDGPRLQKVASSLAVPCRRLDEERDACQAIKNLGRGMAEGRKKDWAKAEAALEDAATFFCAHPDETVLCGAAARSGLEGAVLARDVDRAVAWSHRGRSACYGVDDPEYIDHCLLSFASTLSAWKQPSADEHRALVDAANTWLADEGVQSAPMTARWLACAATDWAYGVDEKGRTLELVEICLQKESVRWPEAQAELGRAFVRRATAAGLLVAGASDLRKGQLVAALCQAMKTSGPVGPTETRFFNTQCPKPKPLP